MSEIKRLMVIFLFLAGLAGLYPAPARAANPETIDSKGIISLVAKNRGKVVVVNFWASWCVPCRQEIPGFVEVRKKYPATDLVMAGVSLDFDPAALARFVQKVPFNYPVYWGAPDVPSTFGIQGIPRTVVYDRKGEKVFSIDGYLEESKLREVVDKFLGKR